MMDLKSREPWIWLQVNEASGKADCGCRLDSAGPDGTPGAAFYMCEVHEAALDMLEQLTLIQAGWEQKEGGHGYPLNPWEQARLGFLREVVVKATSPQAR